jgi:hypothetical protein
MSSYKNGEKKNITEKIDAFKKGNLAEEEGFEPPEHIGSTAFETAAFSLSAILPGNWGEGRGSNPRPLGSHPRALPTELPPPLSQYLERECKAFTSSRQLSM